LALFFQKVFCQAAWLRISGQRSAFGLDWLCFPAIRSRVYCHKPPLQKSLYLFRLLKIGFVFSKTITKLLSFARFKGT
jgi:hypothetical protein